MRTFDAYRDSFSTIRLERTPDGILQVTLHTDGGPWTWDRGGIARGELVAASEAIARDLDNRVIILTGSGERFSGPPASPRTPPGSVESWDTSAFIGHHRALDTLDFPGPVIACINGPVERHPELPFSADIVLAAEDASIVDASHFTNRLTPGDGVAVLLPLLLGWNRGRSFHLTGQTLSSADLLRFGLVNEVLPRDRLLPRARELAEHLIENNPFVLRFARRLLTAPLRSMLERAIPYGHALEALGAIDEAAHGRPAP
jgi:enoyl-CoA hydratase/carnithine racemase